LLRRGWGRLWESYFVFIPIAIFTCVVPILVAFDKLRQPLPELVEGKIGTTQMNIAITKD
jgi:hypothetical protein